MSSHHEFGIGELSRRTGVHIETVRYYEKSGFFPPPPRSKGGHRLYPEGNLRRLVFIRRSRELGFSLDEIRNLLAMVDGGYNCGGVREAARPPDERPPQDRKPPAHGANARRHSNTL